MRFALLLPVWLAFAIVEPSLEHTCPMHGVPVAQHQGPAHAHHGTPAAPHHNHADCTCVGACTAPAVFVPGHAAEISIGWVLERRAVVAVVSADAVSLDSQLRLPFANAPPRVPVIERA